MFSSPPEYDSPSYDDSCVLTPPGYGFSAPASRIIEINKPGYTSVLDTDLVPDVVGSMMGDDGYINGVALVYDAQGSFVGIFTERDYVKWVESRNENVGRSSQEEREESDLLKYALEGSSSAVGSVCTPADKVVAVGYGQSAEGMLKIMKSSGIRHLVVTSSSVTSSACDPPSTSDDVVGVVSMRRIMNVVVSDERLSLKNLETKYPALVRSYDPVLAIQAERSSYANEQARKPGIGKKDLTTVAISLFALLGSGLFLTQSTWLHENAKIGMVGIFVLGYAGIILEEVFEFNKAGVALLMSTALWITYADFYESSGYATTGVLQQLKDQLGEVSDICFFLLAASTIVEVVDAHQGFKVVTNAINTSSKRSLFWVIGFITFFLSSILNNLTVTIVMVSLLRKIVPSTNDRRLFGAMVVVAANAGGVWTPIGDVTTTMLWINHNLSTLPTIIDLFVPSVVCLVASLAFLVGKVEEDDVVADGAIGSGGELPPPSDLAPRGKLVFAAGIASLLSVPIFSELTGLPPYLAMLTGLGSMWALTDAIHMGESESESEPLRVPAALSKLDTSGILFFLGILMSIGVLDKSGLLQSLAVFLDQNLPSQEIIATVIGVASALIDNVPLVAATMGMYSISDFATDDRLWQLIALCAGTGGSILVIGSASGVALMGLEKVDFLWYARNVSLGAAIGYFAGIGAYLAQSAIFKSGGITAMAQAAQGAVHGLHGLGLEAANSIDVASTSVPF